MSLLCSYPTGWASSLSLVLSKSAAMLYAKRLAIAAASATELELLGQSCMPTLHLRGFMDMRKGTSS